MRAWIYLGLCGLLVACAARRASPSSTPGAEPPRAPYGHSYECAPQTELSKPPTDAEIADLERRCVPGQLKDSGSRVTDCPCTQLGLGLSMHPEPRKRARGTKVLMDDCRAGSLLACDSYKLQRQLCLRDPAEAACGPLRAAGLIPKEAFPWGAVLGCRRQRRTLLCLDETRYYFKQGSDEWDQALIESWRREDTYEQARWFATLPSGAELVLTRQHVQSGTGNVPSGDSMPLSASELAAAKRAIASQPKVEERCRAVYECLEALAKQSAPPAPASRADQDGEGEGAEVEVPFAALLTSLRGCERARTLGLATLDGQPVPPSCEQD